MIETTKKNNLLEGFHLIVMVIVLMFIPGNIKLMI